MNGKGGGCFSAVINNFIHRKHFFYNQMKKSMTIFAIILFLLLLIFIILNILIVIIIFNIIIMIIIVFVFFVFYIFKDPHVTFFHSFLVLKHFG